MALILTQEAEERIANFELNRGHECCSCFISPPCSWCTDPDNPHNVHEEDDAWVDESNQSNVKEFVYANSKDYAEPIDYMKAVRDMCR
jgi:hypothetical protein